MVAIGWTVVNHVNHTASMSSPKLKAQLLKGSGTVLTAARVDAFALCEVRATPPASNVAAQRHSCGAAAEAPYAITAAAGGRMNV